MRSVSSADAERRVFGAIEDLRPAYERFLAQLVRVPSPVGHELAAQKIVAEQMRQSGLEVDMFDVDPVRLRAVPGFNPHQREYEHRPCVVGVLRGSGGGRSLILNSHIDTAPVGADEAWRHPAFGGVVEERRLYGRGAWDDKAGCAAMLLVTDAFRRADVRLAGDLILKSVIEDEVTGNGTLACLERGYLADGAVVVDGTWPERVIVSHMGQVSFRVTLQGRSAPACVASRGRNAIRGVGALVEALDRHVAMKNAGVEAWGAAEQPVFVDIGRVRAGEWFGTVPAVCVLEGQYGFVPPDTVVTARQDLQAVMVAAAADSEWPLDDSPVLEFNGVETDPFVGDPANAVVSLLRNTVYRLHSRRLLDNPVTGHCDLRHYARNPWRMIPACLYGPGGGKNAHCENEYFLLDDLPLVAANLAAAALAWCQ
jgi:acetylornithine deacetylase